mgnify:CR=1 FL=1
MDALIGAPIDEMVASRTALDASAQALPRTIRRTVTLQRASGPLVVDVWEARAPAGEPPVLLVHGWGGSSTYWEETARSLAATTDVIVPDLPGAGRSLPLTRPLNLFDQVDALRDVLDALALPRVQVVAHSMGAAITMLLAAREPERFGRLILVSVCLFANAVQQTVYNIIMKVTYLMMAFRHPIMADLPFLSRLAAQKYFFRVPNDPILLRQGMLDYLQMDRATAIACANDACDPAIPQAARAIRSPVLLMACRQDTVTPSENVDYTARIIPDCRVQWIEECGHLPMLEQPAVFMQAVRDFLQLPAPDLRA